MTKRRIREHTRPGDSFGSGDQSRVRVHGTREVTGNDADNSDATTHRYSTCKACLIVCRNRSSWLSTIVTTIQGSNSLGSRGCRSTPKMRQKCFSSMLVTPFKVRDEFHSTRLPTLLSTIPQGTIWLKYLKSTSTLTLNPCRVTHLVSLMPMAATLLLPTQTPVNPGILPPSILHSTRLSIMTASRLRRYQWMSLLKWFRSRMG